MTEHNVDPRPFHGVLPAITTPFAEDGTVDHAFLRWHADWLVGHGSTGIVALGSLGEGATLETPEKHALLRTLVETLGDPAPVVACVSALSTDGAVRIARMARDAGCRGLMVLPPYVHKGPWTEIRGHLEAVLEATDLPCMLYNNPGAYGVDLLPDQIAELAAIHTNVVAVKESSGDVRRLSAVRSLLGERLQLCAGLDDMALEAGLLKVDGWVAGLVNALPIESMALFEAAKAGNRDEAIRINDWFVPLLQLDTVPEFVQLIKLVQSELGVGSERVRAPRRRVEGRMRDKALALIAERMAEGVRPLPRRSA